MGNRELSHVAVRDVTVRAIREADRKYPDTKQGRSLPKIRLNINVQTNYKGGLLIAITTKPNAPTQEKNIHQKPIVTTQNLNPKEEPIMHKIIKR